MSEPETIWRGTGGQNPQADLMNAAMEAIKTIQDAAEGICCLFLVVGTPGEEQGDIVVDSVAVGDVRDLRRIVREGLKVQAVIP